MSEPFSIQRELARLADAAPAAAANGDAGGEMRAGAGGNVSALLSMLRVEIERARAGLEAERGRFAAAAAEARRSAEDAARAADDAVARVREASAALEAAAAAAAAAHESEPAASAVEEVRRLASSMAAHAEQVQSAAADTVDQVQAAVVDVRRAAASARELQQQMQAAIAELTRVAREQSEREAGRAQGRAMATALMAFVESLDDVSEGGRRTGDAQLGADVERLARRARSFAEAAGLEEIPATVGTAISDDLHEVVGGQGRIVECVVQRGFRFGGQVLRRAQVVAKS